MTDTTNYLLCDYCRHHQKLPGRDACYKAVAKVGRKVIRDGQSPQYVCREYEARVSDI